MPLPTNRLRKDYSSGVVGNLPIELKIGWANRGTFSWSYGERENRYKRTAVAMDRKTEQNARL